MGFSTVTSIGSPLKYIPIKHACAHFEIRLTRWNGFDPATSEDPPHPQGFLDAGSPCTQCSPQGRAIGPNYATLDEVNAVIAARSAVDGA